MVFDIWGGERTEDPKWPSFWRTMSNREFGTLRFSVMTDDEVQ